LFNKYIGNTGSFVRVDEPPQTPEPRRPPKPASEPVAEAFAPAPPDEAPRGTHPPRRGVLSAIFGERFALPFGLDASDVILMLLFLYLYAQSGDEEFLFLLAAVAII
jgi:hypothetical protein